MLGSPFCSGQDSFAATATPCFSFFLVFAFPSCSLVVKGGGGIELRSRGVYLMGGVLLSNPLYPRTIPVVALANWGQFVTLLCRVGWGWRHDITRTRRQLNGPCLMGEELGFRSG